MCYVNITFSSCNNLSQVILVNFLKMSKQNSIFQKNTQTHTHMIMNTILTLHNLQIKSLKICYVNITCLYFC